MSLISSKRRRQEKRKYSYKDYVKLPEDGNRYEILNGELIMSLHQSPYIKESAEIFFLN